MFCINLFDKTEVSIFSKLNCLVLTVVISLRVLLNFIIIYSPSLLDDIFSFGFRWQPWMSGVHGSLRRLWRAPERAYQAVALRMSYLLCRDRRRHREAQGVPPIICRSSRRYPRCAARYLLLGRPRVVESLYNS
jgi:hypothetical protein